MRVLTLLCWLAACAPAFAAQDPAAAAGRELERLVSKNRGHGGGVLRISSGPRVVWEGAAGRMAGPDSPPMKPSTPFEIASITKAVTAAVILRLAERGRLSLDSRIPELLPAQEAGGFSPEITVRQLLMHTSGLADYWADKRFLKAFASRPDRFWAPSDVLLFARAMPAHKPPAGFRYSDTNYVLLGRIIECVEGRPLHRVFRDEIFSPLSMSQTWLSYREPRRGEPPSHRFEGAEDLLGVPRQSADWAGGGLVSTADDLAKFLFGLASGRLFRSSETLEIMRAAVPAGEPGISYGCGLYRVDLGRGRGEVWGHDGHGNAFAFYWPRRGLAFTGTLNQTDNDWWPIIEAYLEPDAPGVVLEGAAWGADLSAGWDSLYMFRGVNALRNGAPYGSGIGWVDLNIDWALTRDDALSVEAWNCFSTSGDPYHEFDLSLTYTRSFGDLQLSGGYSLYYGYAPDSFASHELMAVSSYSIPLGRASLTPSLGYYLTLGPDSADGEGKPGAGSGYLLLRVDSSIPLVSGLIDLEPWTAVGWNFEYNSRVAADGELQPFTGWNNFELGLALPLQMSSSITVSPYAAYSLALTTLPDTEKNTFWAGVRVTFSF